MLLHINGKDTMGKLKLETAMSYVKVQVYTNYILLKYKPWHQIRSVLMRNARGYLREYKLDLVYPQLIRKPYYEW